MFEILPLSRFVTGNDHCSLCKNEGILFQAFRWYMAGRGAQAKTRRESSHQLSRRLLFARCFSCRSPLAERLELTCDQAFFLVVVVVFLSQRRKRKKRSQVSLRRDRRRADKNHGTIGASPSPLHRLRLFR